MKHVAIIFGGVTWTISSRYSYDPRDKGLDATGTASLHLRYLRVTYRLFMHRVVA